ncbi:MAG: hypothetical protein KKB70_12120, partial [Proteobacteria bacterium]|nr:hypothetical protein [Pseudomonadota bacterium]
FQNIGCLQKQTPTGNNFGNRQKYNDTARHFRDPRLMLVRHCAYFRQIDIRPWESQSVNCLP